MDTGNFHRRQSISDYNQGTVWEPKITVAGILILLAGVGCGTQTDAGETQQEPSPDRGLAGDGTSGPLLVFLGDSLTAGYGLSEAEAFPALVGEGLDAAGRSVRIVNAGISGDTTAGGLARIDWLLSQAPGVMIVGLGANDGLRGLSLDQTEKNLGEIIRRCLAAGADVLLLGMKIPPSYGPEYSDGFMELFGRLADRHDVALVPFLLAGVAADPALNQGDGIHPNAAGQRLLARNVIPYLEEILEER